MSSFRSFGPHGWTGKGLVIMSSNITQPDNFPFWHPALRLPAPGCHVACMFLMKITWQCFQKDITEQREDLLGAVAVSDSPLLMC